MVLFGRHFRRILVYLVYFIYISLGIDLRLLKIKCADFRERLWKTYLKIEKGRHKLLLYENIICFSQDIKWKVFMVIFRDINIFKDSRIINKTQHIPKCTTCHLGVILFFYCWLHLTKCVWISKVEQKTILITLNPNKVYLSLDKNLEEPNCVQFFQVLVKSTNACWRINLVVDEIFFKLNQLSKQKKILLLCCKETRVEE